MWHFHPVKLAASYSTTEQEIPLKQYFVEVTVHYWKEFRLFLKNDTHLMSLENVQPQNGLIQYQHT